MTTSPGWIVEAMGEIGAIDPALEAHWVRVLTEHLPIRQIADVVHDYIDDESLVNKISRGIIRELTSDSVATTLTDLYQNAARALDTAGVPYGIDQHDPARGAGEPPGPLDLAGRIRWLARQRPTAIELVRVEAERDAARDELVAVTAQRDALDAVASKAAQDRDDARDQRDDLKEEISQLRTKVARASDVDKLAARADRWRDIALAALALLEISDDSETTEGRP